MSESVRVFISHASEDTAYAERLATDLRHAGADVWLDATHLGPGDFVARINAALGARDLLILVLSPAALASKWVPDEMAVGLARFRHGLMRPPIVVAKDAISPEMIPPEWRACPWVDATEEGPDSYAAALALTVHAMQEYDGLHLPADRGGRRISGSRRRPVARSGGRSHVLRTWPARVGLAFFALIVVVVGLTTLARGRSSSAPESDPTTPLWKVSLDGELVGPPAAAGGLLYAGTITNAVYALRATDGAVRWRVQVDDLITAPPVVVGNVLVVGQYNGQVEALRLTDGGRAWQFRTGDRISAVPTLANGILYVASDDGFLYALDAADGTRSWRFPTGGTVTGPPTVVGGIVYIGVSDGQVFALDAVSSTRRWRFNANASIVGAPAVINGTVYVASDDENLYALDVATGILRWRHLTAAGAPGPPLATNGVVYVCDDGRVALLSPPDGRVMRTFAVAQSVTCSDALVLEGHVLYILAGRVYALDAMTGLVLHRYTPTGDNLSNIVVADGHLYGTSTRGYLYAFPS